MSTFKVGEVAVGQNFVNFPQYNSEEFLIVEALAYRRCLLLKNHSWVEEERPCYCVRTANGECFYVEPKNLRKKRPHTTGEESILALFRQNQREGVAA